MRAVDVSPANSSVAVRARRCAAGSRTRLRRRPRRAPPGRARTRPRTASPAAGRAGSRPRSRARTRRCRSCSPAIVAVLAEHEPDLRLGDVPGRVGADADRSSRADRAPAGRVLQEQLRPLRVVDERVDVLDGALVDARVAAPLVRDAGAPHLGRLDRHQQLVRRGQLERLRIERLDGQLLDRGLVHAVRAAETDSSRHVRIVCWQAPWNRSSKRSSPGTQAPSPSCSKTACRRTAVTRARRRCTARPWPGRRTSPSSSSAPAPTRTC